MTLHSSPQPEALERRAASLPERAASFAITSPETFEAASAFLRDVKALRAEVETVFGPMARAAHAAWKAVLGQRQRVEAPMDEAERIVKSALARWIEAKRERARLAQIAAEAAARAAEDERRLAEAAELEAAGDHEEAERVLDEPSFAPPPTPPPLAKAKGISSTDRWSAEVVDLAALVRAVADGKAPLAVLKPDLVALNGMARALRESFSVPGVVARRETSISARKSA